MYLIVEFQLDPFFVPSHEYIEFCSKIPKNAYFEVGMIHRTSEKRSRQQTV